MPLVDLEAGEETSLILASVQGSLERKWSSKKLRKYGEDGDFGILEGISEDLSEIGVYEFVRNGAPRDVALLCELLGKNLLPGITASTLAANRGIKGHGVEEKPLFAGFSDKNPPRISFSLSNIVPDPAYADIVMIGNLLYKKEDVALTQLNSLDGTMKFFRAIPKVPGQKVDLSYSDALLVIVAQIVGSGEECVNTATNYAKHRNAFGRPIGSFQAVKHKLVDSAISIELCRSLYLGMIEDHTLGEQALRYSSRRVSRAITDAIQIHGGVGFTTDVDLHLHLRRVIALSKIYARESSSDERV
ncbi:MAG: acyl-CoA dehydrogenase family protein [Nitrososphaerales archaeon]